ncbi:MAG TPA: hypothetical protein VKS79_02835 [Gemmataceae bacterium]|nr:hypothetical protein [Gemmataceae bacterium]
MFHRKWWVGMALISAMMGASLTTGSGCKLVEDRQREREKEREWEREQAQMRYQRPNNCCPNPCANPCAGGVYPMSGYSQSSTPFDPCACR